MKYIQLILAFLGTIFLIGLPYMLAFWGYNSYYNYNAIEFVPNTYYDVLKTEALYKYSTI